MPLQASTHAIHLKGEFEGRRPASQRGVWQGGLIVVRENIS